MKTLNIFLFEKLHLDKNIKVSEDQVGDSRNIIDDPNKVKTDLLEKDIPSEFNDLSSFPDNKLKRFKKGGDGKADNLWWKFWKILAYNGPMKKETINLSLGLVPTSYSGIYAQLSKNNIIVPDRKRKVLIANPLSQWKL